MVTMYVYEVHMWCPEKVQLKLAVCEGCFVLQHWRPFWQGVVLTGHRLRQFPSASVAQSATALSYMLHWTIATESLQAYFGIFVALAVVPLFLHRHCAFVYNYDNVIMSHHSCCCECHNVRFLHIDVPVKKKHSDVVCLSRFLGYIAYFFRVYLLCYTALVTYINTHYSCSAVSVLSVH